MVDCLASTETGELVCCYFDLFVNGCSRLVVDFEIRQNLMEPCLTGISRFRMVSSCYFEIDYRF